MSNEEFLMNGRRIVASIYDGVEAEPPSIEMVPLTSDQTTQTHNLPPESPTLQGEVPEMEISPNSGFQSEGEAQVVHEEEIAPPPPHVDPFPPHDDPFPPHNDPFPPHDEPFPPQDGDPETVETPLLPVHNSNLNSLSSSIPERQLLSSCMDLCYKCNDSCMHKCSICKVPCHGAVRGCSTMVEGEEGRFKCFLCSPKPTESSIDRDPTFVMPQEKTKKSGIPCPKCGKLFAQNHNVKRHLQKKSCLGKATTSAD